MTTDGFFDPHQGGTMRSAMARIIPTDHEPGATETDFLERYLSGIGFIYAKPYGSRFETLHGLPAEAWRTRIRQLALTRRHRRARPAQPRRPRPRLRGAGTGAAGPGAVGSGMRGARPARGARRSLTASVTPGREPAL